MTTILHGWVQPSFPGEPRSTLRLEIDGVTIFVPDDENNRHRAQLAAWEAAGNVIPEDTGGAGVALDPAVFAPSLPTPTFDPEP
jgi:hypothetical protein